MAPDQASWFCPVGVSYPAVGCGVRKPEPVLPEPDVDAEALADALGVEDAPDCEPRRRVPCVAALVVDGLLAVGLLVAGLAVAGPVVGPVVIGLVVAALTVRLPAAVGVAAGPE